MRLASGLLLLIVSAAIAAEPDKDGFVPMFNGKDLTGWRYVNTPKKTFYVKDGMIITTGHPTGYLRTAKQYENFIAEFDWMHIPYQAGGRRQQRLLRLGRSDPRGRHRLHSRHRSAGARQSHVQEQEGRDHGHEPGRSLQHLGRDLRAGTAASGRLGPLLAVGKSLQGREEWNHYRVEANDGRHQARGQRPLRLECQQMQPRKGYLALESEGSECRFKNLKIKDLPSTNPKPEEIANVDIGQKALFNGAISRLDILDASGSRKQGMESGRREL